MKGPYRVIALIERDHVEVLYSNRAVMKPGLIADGLLMKHFG